MKILDRIEKYLSENTGWSLSDTRVGRSFARGNAFRGKTFLFTGFRNKEWEEIILKNGGEVSNGWSKRVTHLIMKKIGSGSGKEQKAKEAGINIVSKDFFEKHYLKGEYKLLEDTSIYEGYENWEVFTLEDLNEKNSSKKGRCHLCVKESDCSLPLKGLAESDFCKKFESKPLKRVFQESEATSLEEGRGIRKANKKSFTCKECGGHFGGVSAKDSKCDDCLEK